VHGECGEAECDGRMNLRSHRQGEGDQRDEP
jgi:hypothetical protein